MTLGEIRLRVTQRVPGIGLDLLDGFIQDRHTAILDRLEWSRLRVDYAITTAAPFTAGTVALAQGGTAVTLTGGAFASEMTGRVLRANGREEYYEITVTGPTTATLDRGFDGTSGDYAYQILQSVYALPEDARIVESARLLDPPRRLGRKTRAELEQMNRGIQGTPQFWAPGLDAATDPPVQQIELLPIPNTISTLVVSYILEAPSLTGSAVSLLPWMRPAALVAGATADALAWAENDSASDREELKYKGYLQDMIRTEIFSTPPAQLALGSHYTRHRARRYNR